MEAAVKTRIGIDTGGMACASATTCNVTCKMDRRAHSVAPMTVGRGGWLGGLQEGVAMKFSPSATFEGSTGRKSCGEELEECRTDGYGN